MLPKRILVWCLIIECGVCFLTSFVPLARISSVGPAQTQASGESASNYPIPSSSLGNNQSNPYNFWDENYTLALFNLDLHNLSVENPLMAIDLLNVTESLFNKEPSNRNLFLPDSASYTTVIEGLSYGNHNEAAEKAQALLNKMEESNHLEPR
jgi:hypothetical protein